VQISIGEIAEKEAIADMDFYNICTVPKTVHLSSKGKAHFQKDKVVYSSTTYLAKKVE
jgi:hypothetical protein